MERNRERFSNNEKKTIKVKLFGVKMTGVCVCEGY